METNKHKMEINNHQIETDKLKMETNKHKMEIDKHKMETNKYKMETNKCKIETDKTNETFLMDQPTDGPTDMRTYTSCLVATKPRFNLNYKKLQHVKKLRRPPPRVAFCNTFNFFLPPEWLLHPPPFFVWQFLLLLLQPLPLPLLLRNIFKNYPLVTYLQNDLY